MSTFQIAISVCLLTFFLVTGCNDLTQSKNQSLNSQIVKEVQDADAQMAEQQSEPQSENTGMTTTVEIIKKENREAETSNAATMESQSSTGEGEQSLDKIAQAEKQDAKKAENDASAAQPMDSATDTATNAK